MKQLCFFLFVLLAATCSITGTAQEKQFRLTDTAFVAGATYSACAISFDFNGHNEVLPRAYPCLDSLADLVIRHPEIVIEIGSHTDSRGSDSFNLKISQARANSVDKYLLDKGVPRHSLAAVGYGETAPVVPQKAIDNETDKAKKELLHQQNRRTVFRILHVYTYFSLTDTAFSAGAIMRLPVLFDLNKATLRPESKPLLDSLGNFLLAHPELIIEIGSHSDSRYSTAYSSCLPCKRANTIADYLVAYGVPAAQVMHRGYNDAQLLIPDAYISNVPSKEGKEKLHALNRRTEVRIISIR